LAPSKRIIGYYTNWSQYRSGGWAFFPENVNPSLLTNAIFAFATVTPAYSIATYEWNDDTMYGRFNALKTANPNLKTSIAVGGWNFNFRAWCCLTASLPTAHRACR
jgi:chitinase